MLSGDSPFVAEPKNTIARAERLNVTWNQMNFLTLQQMFLPHMAAIRTDQKSSLVRIISAFSLATEQPVPIAKPTSAVFKASTSAIPSPETATVLFCSIKVLTKRYLSYGVALAITLTPFLKVFLKFFNEALSGFSANNYLNSSPVMHSEFKFSLACSAVIIPA